MGVRVSVVLPVYNQADHIGAVVRGYLKRLKALKASVELILVVNGSRDASAAVCRALASEDKRVRVLVSKAGGWGLAVKLGLKAAKGELLCFSNSARTSSDELLRVLRAALERPDSVVKADRRVRGELKRRVGSWLYNAECRLLLGTEQRDVNGTPKAFPRGFKALRGLREDGDLLDAEFCALCARHAYPVLELPFSAQARHGGASTTKWGSAWRMYKGVLGLRARLGAA